MRGHRSPFGLSELSQRRSIREVGGAEASKVRLVLAASLSMRRSGFEKQVYARVEAVKWKIWIPTNYCPVAIAASSCAKIEAGPVNSCTGLVVWTKTLLMHLLRAGDETSFSSMQPKLHLPDVRSYNKLC